MQQTFTKDVYKLLNKNLNFVPTEKKIYKKTFDKVINGFQRCIKLKAHFKDPQAISISLKTKYLKKPSSKSWIPTKIHHTKEIKKALKSLKVRDGIVITNALKGGAVVSLDVKDYVRECERQLNNIENYRHLQKDPTVTNNKLVHKVIKRFVNEKLIRKNIADRLKINSPRTPRFYTQPKIHTEGNPGIPFKSSLNCYTSKISQYIDYHFQLIAKQTPSYFKDTIDFKSKIKAIENVPDNSYLVSLDVKSLYTNIPNSEGIKAMKTSLDNFPEKAIATKVVTTFQSLIITLNNFVFNCQNNLQIKGSAIGTICALSYANTFMDHFGRKRISPYLQGISLIYLRLIDDILFT